MNPTKQSLLNQMNINALEINRRKALLGFTQEDAQRLAACQDFILDEVDNLVGTFYDKQTAVDEISLIIGDADTLGRLSAAMVRYVSDLFTGVYDEAYVNNRLRIGIVHKRIGVSPKYYLSAMHLLKSLLMDVMRRNLPDYDTYLAAATALDKLLYLDNEFVFETYIRSMLSEIETAREAALQHASLLEDKVAERTRELEDLARKDPLTGLFNQRYFREGLERELTRAQRKGAPLCLLYLDLDGFKGVNDTQGHLAGDALLRLLADIVRQHCRSYDLPCRYGGDEFCVLLPDTLLDEARAFADRVQGAAATAGTPILLSIGLVQAGPQHWPTSAHLVEAADHAMYAAKRQGGAQQMCTVYSLEQQP
jgi:diguanylate cyclase (GGDEF)-like protein